MTGVLHEKTGLATNKGIPDPSTHPNEYSRVFKTKMEQFWFSTLLDQQNQPQLSATNTTWVFPTVQVGPCDVLIDQSVVDLTVEHVNASQSLHITTPYCNFSEDFSQVLLRNCRSRDVRVIVAHPRANGFFKGKGAHTLIPWAYSAFLERFFNVVNSSGNGDRVQLKEYERENWTFHTKGLWFEFPAVEQNPVVGVSIVGSSNFGVRSAARDLEAQAVVVSSDQSLIARMRHVRCCCYFRAK